MVFISIFMVLLLIGVALWLWRLSQAQIIRFAVLVAETRLIVNRSVSKLSFSHLSGVCKGVATLLWSRYFKREEVETRHPDGSRINLVNRETIKTLSPEINGDDVELVHIATHGVRRCAIAIGSDSTAIVYVPPLWTARYSGWVSLPKSNYSGTLKRLKSRSGLGLCITAQPFIWL